MIINKPTSNATATGFAGSGNFSIKASSKAFRILSDNIYKDKIAAIVRELSTNAVDSHFDAKQDKQFVVNLPDPLDPVFRIRDFGTGLDHDDVMSLYTTYFETTKDKSNDYNGTLGLGSKAPFSYTNTFNVTSFFNGVKRLYTAYISEEDTPSILYAGEQPTDEENGLEISFSVNKEDFSKFQKAASYIYYWFDNKPLVNGKTPEYVPFAKIEHEQDNWFIYSRHGYYGYENTKINDSYIKQANIGYPISIEELSKNRKLTDSQIEILSKNIVINVPTGSVNFAPSREELNYDSHTIDNILKEVDKIHTQLCDHILSTLKSETSAWERTILYNEKFGRGSLYLKSIGTKVDIFDGKFNLPPNTRVYTYYSGKRPNTRYTNDEFYDKNSNKWVPATENLTIDGNSIGCGEDTTFYTFNNKLGGIVAFENYRHKNIGDYCGSRDVFICGDKENVDFVLKSLGNPKNVINLDSVLKKEKKKETTAYFFDMQNQKTNFVASTKSGTAIKEDIEDLSGYYIMTKTFSDFHNVKCGNYSFGPWYMKNLYQYGRNAGLDIPNEIYVIRDRDIETVKDNPSLKPWFDVCLAKIKDFNIVESLSSSVVHNLTYHDKQLLTVLKKLNYSIVCDDIRKVIDYFKSNDGSSTDIYKWFKNFIQSFPENSIDKEKILKDNSIEHEFTKVNNMFEVVHEKYPLLTKAYTMSNTTIENYITAMQLFAEQLKGNVNATSNFV